MERTLNYTLSGNIHRHQPNTFDSLNLIETGMDAHILRSRTVAEERRLAEEAIRRFKEESNDENSHLNLIIQHNWHLTRAKFSGRETTDDMSSGAYISDFCMSALETEIRHNFEDDIPAPEGLPTNNELLISSLKDLEYQLDNCDPIGVSGVMDTIIVQMPTLNNEFDELDRLAKDYEYDKAGKVLSVIMKKIEEQ
ncbi:MAG: hypothetical protein GY795_41230 [Desulfobacterales bacterium]|nr:hypothetical protein [Desulfobacterales bacterium]